MTDRRRLILICGVIVSITALWILPPLGFLAVGCMAVALVPWGSSLTERVLGLVLVTMGIAALVSTRLVPLPITTGSVHATLSLGLLALLGVSQAPSYRARPIPRPRLGDWMFAGAFVSAAAWLLFAYFGRSTEQTLAGLFFTGWDNQAHFTTFANTYETGSMTWPTPDGSIAWNQWYPALHTTLWAMGQLAFQATGQLTRPELLAPFVTWSGLSAALAFAAMAWVAGDLASRLVAKGESASPLRSWARCLAVLGVLGFLLLGSSSRLFNYGFTNFIMGVAVISVASYLATVTVQRARLVGPALITLAGLATIGMWTPLIVGLVPAGAAIALRMWRNSRVAAIAWVLCTGALLGGIAIWQSRQIIAASGLSSTGDFSTNLGGIVGGSVPFNLALAMAAPLAAICLGVLIGQRRTWGIAAGVAGPAVGVSLVLLVMVSSADASSTSRLQSYYVLKTLNAVLLVAIPLIIAAVAIAIVLAMASIGLLRQPRQAVVACIGAGVVGIGVFGFIGPSNASLAPGFATAPGIVGAIDRVSAVNDTLGGEVLLKAAAMAQPYSRDYTSMLWDGAGTLPNLWIQSLTGVVSDKRYDMLSGLPPFPYDQAAVDYVKQQMDKDPKLRMAMLWFRDPTRVLLEPLLKTKGDYFVELVQMPMRSSSLCPECHL